MKDNKNKYIFMFNVNIKHKKINIKHKRCIYFYYLSYYNLFIGLLLKSNEIVY